MNTEPPARRGTVVTLAIASLVLVTGCIAGGERLGSQENPNAPSVDTQEEAASDDAASPGSSAEPSSGSGNATGSANASSPEEAGDGTSPSSNGPDSGDERPIPANVTLANATVVERTPERVVFRWTGTLPAQLPGEEVNVSTELNVPPDRWLAVNATLTTDPHEGINWITASTDGMARCGDGSFFPDGAQRKICESRPEPLEDWETWTVRVGRASAPLLPVPELEPVGFTVNLTVEHVGPDGPWGDLQRDPGGPGEWPDPGDARIRPGAQQFGGGCTLNFVFHSTRDRSLYVGTAAHCVSGLAEGALVRLGGMPGAARLVYCSWGTGAEGSGRHPCPSWSVGQNATVRNDFALLEVKPSLADEVHPSVIGWGGPTGMSAGVSLGDRAYIYGNSTLREAGRDEPPERTDRFRAVVRNQTNWTTNFKTAGVVPGDSGGPALDEQGRALGVASYISIATVPVPPFEIPGDFLATLSSGDHVYSRVPKAVGFVNERTDLEVRLATWPHFDPRPGLPANTSG